MDQIKMADYSNFLSEADESNLQHEAILCEKRKKKQILKCNQFSCLHVFI